MSVSLAKTPTLRLFLAVTTDENTPAAKVHRLVLTHDDGYDELLTEMHAARDEIPGAALHCVIAIDRSSGYAAALKGECTDAEFTAWIAQEGW